MPSYKDIYGEDSPLLNAKKVKEQGLTGKPYTIKSVEPREIKDKKKLFLAFNEMDNELVLNKTNSEIIAQKLGDDYTKWPGEGVQLTLVKAKYNNELVDSIQVQV